MPNHIFMYPPSSYHSAAFIIWEEKEQFSKYQHLSLLWVVCLFSSLSHPMGSLISLYSMPLDGLLKRSVLWLDNLGLIGVDLIHNKDIYISVLFA